MTDQTKAPREWTYFNCSTQEMMVPGNRPEGRCHNCKEVLHVIEFSAFKALELERDELKAELVKQSIYREGLIGNLGHAVSTRADCDYSMVVEQNVLAQFIAKERDAFKDTLEFKLGHLKEVQQERDHLRQLLSECVGVLERIETEDNGWAGFEAAKALTKLKQGREE